MKWFMLSFKKLYSKKILMLKLRFQGACFVNKLKFWLVCMFTILINWFFSCQFWHSYWFLRSKWKTRYHKNILILKNINISVCRSKCSPRYNGFVQKAQKRAKMPKISKAVKNLHWLRHNLFQYLDCFLSKIHFISDEMFKMSKY